MTRIDTAAVLAVPREEIPDALGELRRVEAILQARLLAPQEVDQLLTATEAARLLRVSADTLYRRGDELPFAVRVGSRLRFSRLGIARWVEEQGEGI